MDEDILNQEFEEEEIEETDQDQVEEEGQEADEQTEADQQTEEFDEITYNGQQIKISANDRQTYLQKGYNYDKVSQKATEQEEFIKTLENRFGMNRSQILQSLEEQQVNDEASRIEEEQGVSPEIALKIAQQEKRIRDIEEDSKRNKALTYANQQKESLKNEFGYKELIDEAMTLVSADVDLSTAFYFLRGKKANELMSNNNTARQKSQVADIHDSRKRRGASGGSKGASESSINPLVSRLSNVFKTDPNKIGRYVRDNLKK